MSGVEMRDAREEDEGVRGHCVLGAGFPVASAIKEPLTALRDPSIAASCTEPTASLCKLKVKNFGFT